MIGKIAVEAKSDQPERETWSVPMALTKVLTAASAKLSHYAIKTPASQTKSLPFSSPSTNKMPALLFYY
jgi:hypothetical protein